LRREIDSQPGNPGFAGRQEERSLG